MRREKIDPTEDENLLNRWIIVEWSEVDDLLEGIDANLKQYGLELVVGDADGSDIFVKVEKREAAK